jgi:hypothetical protein
MKEETTSEINAQLLYVESIALKAVKKMTEHGRLF